MDVLIVGAGPTGLTLGAALAHRGHRVVAVDPDPGPSSDGSWRRRGVMQFDHPHGFRPQVRDLLEDEWPDAWEVWRALGALPVPRPRPAGSAGSAGSAAGAEGSGLGVRSRRSTYERALRQAAASVDGLTVAVGRVEGLVAHGRHGRVTGAVVDGATVAADLVVDASGRLSRFAAPADLGGDTGMSYVTRTYRRRPGAPAGPMSGPVAWSAELPGYDAYVFPHERDHVSAVIIRPTADAELGVLRHTAVFDAACRAIPGMAEWTDPAHATPTSDVMVGGRLLNIYRPQLGRPGLVAVGDTVATTAPTAGRGVAMASMQIAGLLRLLDDGAHRDLATVAEPFGEWCATWIRPWVEDHLAIDGARVRHWQGHDVDLSRPLTAEAIAAAARVDPRIGPYLDGFMAMTALPDSLAPAQPLARAVYESGWRPAPAEGPTRDDLVGLGLARIDLGRAREQARVA
jgi:2-polyprenyl-6-methoxyphenol hydroxylase-like FAD-dependent oxidoreductase